MLFGFFYAGVSIYLLQADGSDLIGTTVYPDKAARGIRTHDLLFTKQLL